MAGRFIKQGIEEMVLGKYDRRKGASGTDKNLFKNGAGAYSNDRKIKKSLGKMEINM
jgi:hypothetical protein